MSLKKENYELSLVDRDSEIITHNLKTSEKTQIFHVSVESKQYSVHPSQGDTKKKKIFKQI